MAGDGPGRKCPGRVISSGTNAAGEEVCTGRDGGPCAEVTAAERAAIERFLAAPGAAAGGPGRARTMALAALKFAGALLLAAGVVAGYADGDDLDEVGCTVAHHPGGISHRGRSARAKERGGGGGVPGSGAGAGGGCGDGGPARGKAERLKPGGCAHRMPDGRCQVTKDRCRLLSMENEEWRVKTWAEEGARAERRFVLRKGVGAWTVVFDGRSSVLPDEKGAGYVAVLLMSPWELIAGAELAHRAFGHAVVEDQRNLAVDDRETVREMGEARRKCQAVIDEEGASEVEREEARAELEEIGAWARKHVRGTEGNEQRQVRAVRQAIRRLLEGLQNALDARGEADGVLRAFGEHLERYLWRPSSRGGHGRSSRVRAGLAGRFTYEPPDGVKWSG